MKVFVTGGTGFIGGAVVRQLRARGDEVVCLVRNPGESERQLVELGCQTVAGDLGDDEAIRAGMEGCDAVIHAAAVYEVGIPVSARKSMQEANVGGTERVLGAALEAGVGRVVYVSTVGVFGNTHGQVVDESYEHPAKGEFTSCYEETKWEAHQIAKRMIREEGLPCVIVQPGGVYGPGDTSSIGALLDQFLSGKMPLMPFPELGICLTHVEDIAAGIILALDKGKPGEAYILSGPATTVGEAIDVVAAQTGKKAPKHALPTGVMKALTPIGPLVGKLMGQPPNLRELIASADGVTFWASYDKADQRAWLRAARARGGAAGDARASGTGGATAGRLRRVHRCSRRLPRMRVIDVMHLGRPHVIGCWEVDGALVDPGPESSLGTLLEALGDERPEAILLTHIHLDHAAATGAMVARWPDLPVYVHERGAPHIIDPSRLLASAMRLYGDKLEYLWGEIQPVPEANVTTLSGRRDGARHACRLHPRPRLPPRLLFP